MIVETDPLDVTFNLLTGKYYPYRLRIQRLKEVGQNDWVLVFTSF